MRHTKTAAWLVVMATALCTGAWAHGDEAHKKAAGPARKEQKAWGIAGDAGKATRTIEIRMDDKMRFTPDRIDVR